MRTGKVAIFLAVAAAHVAVVVMSKRWSYRAPAEQSRFAIWTPEDIPAHRLQDDREIVDVSTRAVPLTVSIPVVEMNDSIDDVEPDWRELGSQAIQSRLGKQAEEAAQRSLMSKPNALEPSRNPDVPSMFKTPAFKAGDAQRFEDGEIITWVSDRCYYTNRQIGSVLSSKSAVKVCLLTPPMLGGDGFPDDIKPDYLRKPPSIPDQNGNRVELP